MMVAEQTQAAARRRLRRWWERWPERAEQARALMAAGQPDVAIAEAVGLSKTTVSRWRRGIGLRRKVPRPPWWEKDPSRAAAVRADYDAGAITGVLAQRHGVSLKMVRHWLKAHGLTFHTQCDWSVRLPELAALARAAYDRLATDAAIAELCGLNVEQVRQWRKRHELPAHKRPLGWRAAAAQPPKLRPGTRGGELTASTERPGTRGGELTASTERPGTRGGGLTASTERPTERQTGVLAVAIRALRTAGYSVADARIAHWQGAIPSGATTQWQVGRRVLSAPELLRHALRHGRLLPDERASVEAAL
jgi:hypothetical protein